MIALHAYRSTLHSCGHSLEESTAEDAEGAYRVDPPTRCHACTAIAIKQAEYTETPQREALLWHATRR